MIKNKALRKALHKLDKREPKLFKRLDRIQRTIIQVRDERKRIEQWLKESNNIPHRKEKK